MEEEDKRLLLEAVKHSAEVSKNMKKTTELLDETMKILEKHRAKVTKMQLFTSVMLMLTAALIIVLQLV